jgi:outer membrane lipoprotein-sorting protein
MFFRAAILSLLLFIPLAADNTQEVLARLDREAAAFRQVTARLTRATHTAVLNDTTKETGQMWLRRAGKNVLVRTEMADPDPRSYSFDGSTGQLYYPKINTVQIWELGKSRSLVDQLLLLGFGSSGKELAKNYTIAAAGEETVGGRSATRIELTPKSAKLKEQFEKVELWIAPGAGYPIQQKFHQPGGDYYLVTYSDVRINPELPESAFRLKLPADVKREYPQK